VAELNGIAESSEMVWGNGEKIRRLKPHDAVQLEVFRNGLRLGDSKFQSFSDDLAKQIIRDLLDGYFPYELKARYPEGVPLKVLDRTSDDFALPFQAFRGNGQRLVHDSVQSAQNDKSSSSSSIFSAQHAPGSTQHNIIHDMKSLKEDNLNPNRKIEKNAFLNKLPKSVIKSGKIITIREDIEALLQGKTTDRMCHQIQTPAVRLVRASRPSSAKHDSADDFKVKVDNKAAGDNKAEGETTRIQVRSEEGKRWFLVMKVDDTLRTLRQKIRTDKMTRLTSFDICTAFPDLLILSNNSQTLLEAGLLNAVIHLKSKPS